MSLKEERVDKRCGWWRWVESGFGEVEEKADDVMEHFPGRSRN